MERPRRGPVWLGIDVACVLVFSAVGRRSHDEGLNIAGIASTAWPFLSGTALGWLAAQAWRRPTAVYPTGVVVWLCTVVVGMVLRKATSAGVAAAGSPSASPAPTGRKAPATAGVTRARTHTDTSRPHTSGETAGS